MLLEHPTPAIRRMFWWEVLSSELYHKVPEWHCASPLICLVLPFSFWSKKRELVFPPIVPSHCENKHIKNARFMNSIVKKRKGESHERTWAECSDFGWGGLDYSGAVLNGDAYTIFKASFSTDIFVQSPSKLLHLTHRGTRVPVLSLQLHGLSTSLIGWLCICLGLVSCTSVSAEAPQVSQVSPLLVTSCSGSRAVHAITLTGTE